MQGTDPPGTLGQPQRRRGGRGDQAGVRVDVLDHPDHPAVRAQHRGADRRVVQIDSDREGGFTGGDRWKRGVQPHAGALVADDGDQVPRTGRPVGQPEGVGARPGPAEQHQARARVPTQPSEQPVGPLDERRVLPVVGGFGAHHQAGRFGPDDGRIQLLGTTEPTRRADPQVRADRPHHAALGPARPDRPHRAHRHWVRSRPGGRLRGARVRDGQRTDPPAHHLQLVPDHGGKPRPARQVRPQPVAQLTEQVGGSTQRHPGKVRPALVDPPVGDIDLTVRGTQAPPRVVDLPQPGGEGLGALVVAAPPGPAVDVLVDLVAQHVVEQLVVELGPPLNGDVDRAADGVGAELGHRVAAVAARVVVRAVVLGQPLGQPVVPDDRELRWASGRPAPLLQLERPLTVQPRQHRHQAVFFDAVQRPQRHRPVVATAGGLAPRLVYPDLVEGCRQRKHAVRGAQELASVGRQPHRAGLARPPAGGQPADVPTARGKHRPAQADRPRPDVVTQRRPEVQPAPTAHRPERQDAVWAQEQHHVAQQPAPRPITCLPDTQDQLPGVQVVARFAVRAGELIEQRKVGDLADHHVPAASSGVFVFCRESLMHGDRAAAVELAQLAVPGVPGQSAGFGRVLTVEQLPAEVVQQSLDICREPVHPGGEQVPQVRARDHAEPFGQDRGDVLTELVERSSHRVQLPVFVEPQFEPGGQEAHLADPALPSQRRGKQDQGAGELDPRVEQRLLVLLVGRLGQREDQQVGQHVTHLGQGRVGDQPGQADQVRRHQLRGVQPGSRGQLVERPGALGDGQHDRVGEPRGPVRAGQPVDPADQIVQRGPVAALGQREFQDLDQGARQRLGPFQPDVQRCVD
ncbi:hypothetical protein GCM10023321_50380 [Pseudonocardia eucalypti]|uniref:Uncharacterized protein n=1 Tax=Pseudonocardia eucalypti TaxID=648755 RepID=A0ABP9QKL9_9PSEU